MAGRLKLLWYRQRQHLLSTESLAALAIMSLSWGHVAVASRQNRTAVYAKGSLTPHE